MTNVNKGHNQKPMEVDKVKFMEFNEEGHSYIEKELYRKGETNKEAINSDDLALTKEQELENEFDNLKEIELDDSMLDFSLDSLDAINFDDIEDSLNKDKELQQKKSLEQLEADGLVASIPPVKYEQSMTPLINDANKNKTDGTLSSLSELEGLDDLIDLTELDDIMDLDELGEFDLTELDSLEDESFEGRLLTEGEKEEYIQRLEKFNEAFMDYQVRANSASSKGKRNLTFNILNNLDNIADRDLVSIRSVFDVTTFFNTMKPISLSNDFTMDTAEEALNKYTESLYQHEILERADQLNQVREELEEMSMDEADRVNQKNDLHLEQNNLLLIKERFDNGTAFTSIRDFYFAHVNPAHKEMMTEEMKTDDKINQKNNLSQISYKNKQDDIDKLRDSNNISITKDIKRKTGIVKVIENGVESHKSIKETIFNCGNCKEESSIESGFVLINDYPLSSSDREDSPAILLTHNHFECKHCGAPNILPLTVLEKLDNYAKELFESRISSEQRRAGGNDAQLKIRTQLMKLDKLGVIADGEINVENLDVDQALINKDKYTPVKFIEKYRKLQTDWLNRNKRFTTEKALTDEANPEFKETAYIQYLLSSYNNAMYKPGIGTKLAYSVIDTVSKTTPYQILRQLNQHIKDSQLSIFGLEKYETFILEVLNPSSKLIKMLDTTEKSFLDFQKEIRECTGILGLDVIEEFSIHGVHPIEDNCHKVLTSIETRKTELQDRITNIKEQIKMFEAQVFNSQNYKNITYTELNVAPLSLNEFFRLCGDKNKATKFISEVINNLLINSSVKALHGYLNTKYNLNTKVRGKVTTGASPLEAFRDLKMLDKSVLKVTYGYEQVYPLIKSCLSYLRLKDWYGFLKEAQKIELDSITIPHLTGSEGNVKTNKMIEQLHELINFIRNIDFTLLNEYDSKYSDKAREVMNLEGLGWTVEELLIGLDEINFKDLPPVQNYRKRRGTETLTDWVQDVQNGSIDSSLQAKKYENLILTAMAFMVPYEDIFRAIHLACENPKASDIQVSTYIRLYLQTIGIPYHLIKIKESIIASNYNRNNEWLDFKIDTNKDNTFITLDDIINSVPSMAPKHKVDKKLFKVFEIENLHKYINQVNPMSIDENVELEDINIEKMEAFVYWLTYQANEINAEWLEDTNSYQELMKTLDDLNDSLSTVKNTLG